MVLLNISRSNAVPETDMEAPLGPRRGSRRGSRSSMTEEELKSAIAASFKAGPRGSVDIGTGKLLDQRQGHVDVALGYRLDSVLTSLAKTRPSEPYISTEAARATILQATQDMETMKEEHEALVLGLGPQLEDIQTKNREYYLSLIADLKSRAYTALGHHKRLRAEAQKEHEVIMREQVEVAESLRDKIAEHKIAFDEMVQQHQRQLKEQERAAQEAKETLKQACEAEQARAKRAHEENKLIEKVCHGTLTRILAQVEQRAGEEREAAWEERDSRREQWEVEARKGLSQAKEEGLRSKHAAAVSAFKIGVRDTREDRLRHELAQHVVHGLVLELVADVEQGVFSKQIRSLSKQVQAVHGEVSRLQDESASKQRAMEELKGENTRLEKEIEDLLTDKSGNRVTEEQLQDARKALKVSRKKELEFEKQSQAWLVQAANAEMTGARKEEDKWFLALDLVAARRTAGEREGRIKEYRAALKKLTAANEKLSQELAVKASAAPVLQSPGPVEVEAAAAASSEALPEVTGALSRVREEEEACRQELDAATQKKKAMKQEIKDWMKAFEAENGRPPSNEDKGSIKDKFVMHKKLEAEVKALTKSLQQAEAAMEAEESKDSIRALPAAEGEAVQADDPSAKGSEEVESLKKMLKDANKKRDVLQQALGELNETTARMLAENQTKSADIQVVKDLEEQLEGAVQRERQTNLDLKRAEFALQEAGQRAVAAEQEAAAAQLVVDESSEVARLRVQIESLKKDLAAKSNAARSGWDAAAVAESELEAAVEAGRSEGIKIGRKEDRKKAESTALAQQDDTQAKEQLEQLQAEVQAERDRADGLLAQVDALGAERGLLEEKLTLAEREVALAAELAEAVEAPEAQKPVKPAELHPGLKAASDLLKSSIHKGTALWKEGKRDECYALYADVAAQLVDLLPEGEPSAASLQTAQAAAAKVPAAKGAVVLRKAFDAVLGSIRKAKAKLWEPAAAPAAEEPDPSAQARISDLKEQMASLSQRRGSLAEGSPPSEGVCSTALAAAVERGNELEAELQELQAEHDALLSAGSGAGAGAGKGKGGGSDAAAAKAQVQKIKLLEKKAKEEAAKIRKLEAALADAKVAASRGGGGGGTDAGGADAKAAERQLAQVEKKHKKALDDLQKKLQKEGQAAKKSLESTTAKLGTATGQLEELTVERDRLKKDLANMGSMGKEIEKLRARAEEANQLEVNIAASTERVTELEGLYKEETALRKKYWNMMEDMKGKIRVYARCRPMAAYEIERGCSQAVKFVDVTTVQVDSNRGPKEFVYDTVFTPDHSQEQVFEDTKNLIQSSFDGYNVCLFAYGQTGSGKTWTMSGSESCPGITPRAIQELFALKDAMKAGAEVSISCYFVELYLDQLRDLFYAMENPRDNKPPKLDIKVDAKKMVVIKNALVREAATAEELSKLFEKGNAMRKVGGTKMNAESSRSHSIFSVLIEVHDKTTKKTGVGKLSLVDLAGSERADKTGATGDRIKEAQSINKSLSALGDVISALSTQEKFIPYRNNKLTQVMQDSLGGNAKTLMFVNISPADYNQEETLTSLTYASRVKLITNDANKNQESEEVSRLKGIIKRLKEGEPVDVVDEE